MDYRGILKSAELKLGPEFETVIQDIKDCIAAGSTGGEIIGMVGKYVKDLKSNNYQAYLILKNDIELYLEDCRKNGRFFY